MAIVDDIDGDLKCLKWYINDKTRRNSLYANMSGTRIAMHRVILERKIGRSLLSKEQVDHINGDGLDNRRSNLRIASSTQNHHNCKKLDSLLGKPTTSEYKGVRWEPDRKKWRADIRIDGKKVYLGRFDVEIDAANAYDQVANTIFGEFARLNDPRRRDFETAKRMES